MTGHRYVTAARRTAVLVTAALVGCGGGAPEPPPPPAVTVAQPERRAVEPYVDFTGTTRAVESAQIQARVSGILERQLYTASDVVRAGQVLFVIEPDQYAAIRDEALGQMRAAIADSALKESNLERIELAIQTNAVSQQDLDRARAERDAAVAAVIGARARLARAQLDLDYTQVRSPITGQAGRRLVDPGNLVGVGEATLLTTVNQLQPIHVYFDAPEWVVLRILSNTRGRRSVADSAVDGTSRGSIQAPPDVVRVFVGTAADAGEFPIEGEIDFIANTVDPSTGTIELRAVFANEDLALFPGLFVRVRVRETLAAEALLIQEAAVGADLGGKYVYVVGNDGVVEQRYVELGQPQPDGAIMVTDGLDGSETYIVNGLLRARPGFPVTPMTEAEAAAAASGRAGAGGSPPGGAAAGPPEDDASGDTDGDDSGTE